VTIDTSEIKRILTQRKSWKVLVIGDVMVDEYDFCYSSQSKEIPSEKRGKRAYLASKRIVAPGGAANAGVNLHQLGGSVTLLGVTGLDGYETVLRRECEIRGVHTILLADDSRPTTLKRRVYVDDEYFLRIDNESDATINENLSRQAIEICKQRFLESQVIVVSDYKKGIFTEALSRVIVDMANERNLPLIIDCKPSHIALFRGAPTVVINLPEAQTLVPQCAVNDSLVDSIKELYHMIGAKRLAVTLGARGICGFDGLEFYRETGIPVVARDAVGAGDTVRAAFALAAAYGLSLPQTLKVANVCGALVVARTGTSGVTLDEVIDALDM
jgi:rfaE bifunctional protein kinase chain/domain